MRSIFFNNAYINVVENTGGKKPLSFLDKDNITFSTMRKVFVQYIQNVN